MKKLLFILLGALVAICAFAQIPNPLKVLVTQGIVLQKGNTFTIDSKSTRMEFEQLDGNKLSISVKYSGVTKDVSRLGNGDIFSQVALKLRSANQCNLVYVARRISPDSEVAVLIKENPGKSTHEECKDGGYRRVAFVKLPVVNAGQSFSLGGSFGADGFLTVEYNGKAIWSGNTGWVEVGDSGVRTDNAKVVITVKDTPPSLAKTNDRPVKYSHSKGPL